MTPGLIAYLETLDQMGDLLSALKLFLFDKVKSASDGGLHLTGL
jgi:hypothetical protein